MNLSTDKQKKSWAMLSLSHKEGLVELAKKLVSKNFSLLATDGTRKYLEAHQIKAHSVSSLSQIPELIGGRVKSLHPYLYAGILYKREEKSHCKELEKYSLPSIDLVICNLYPFREEVLEQKKKLEEASDFIDIGGPSLIRAAAKNWPYCLPVTCPSDYPKLSQALDKGLEQLSKNERLYFAKKAFDLTAKLDQNISMFLSHELNKAESKQEELPESISFELRKKKKLRYGENAQQEAASYQVVSASHNLEDATKHQQLQGKELSYNNLCDLKSAIHLIKEFPSQTAACFVKHNNPCGLAAGQENLSAIIQKAYLADSKSAFGGIFACNQTVDLESAKQLAEIFLECLIAPKFSAEALSLLAHKKSLRILETTSLHDNKRTKELNLSSHLGSFLIQTSDEFEKPEDTWQEVSKRPTSPSEWQDLCLAAKVSMYVKSNAIVIAKKGQTLGIGAGQMSRIDATELAIKKAGEFSHPLKGAVLASDGFFPFADCVELAAQAGISACVQPGGSIRDQESVDKANEKNIAMIFSKRRHFKH